MFRNQDAFIFNSSCVTISLPSVLANQEKFKRYKNSQAAVDRNIFHLSDPRQTSAWCWQASCSLSHLLPKDREPRWYPRTHTHTQSLYKQELRVEALGKLVDACSPFQNIIKMTRLRQAQVLRTLVTWWSSSMYPLCLYLERCLHLRNRFDVSECCIPLKAGGYAGSAFWVIDTN